MSKDDMEKLKTQLKQYSHIMKNIDNLENRLYEIDNKLYSVGGGYNTDDRVQTNKDPDKWTELLDKKIRLEEEINAKLAQSYTEMMRIEKIINGLDEEEKLLMRLKYIDCLTWEEVAVNMGYTWRHIHRIHGRCLMNIINSENVIVCQ